MNPLSLLLRRPFKRAGSAWAPSALSGLFLWHEPSLTLDYTDAARTAPVTADGDPIGGETDRSAAANHLTQSTSTKRPLIKQYTNAGKTFWSTLFDGVDDYLAHDPASSGPSGTNRLFVCTAVRATDLASNWALFHVGAETSKASIQFLVRSGALSMDYWTGSGIATTGALSLNTYYVVTGYFDGANFVVRLNGVQKANVAVAGVVLGSGKCQFGNIVSAALPWHGDCPLLLAANTVPSAAQIAQAETYVGARVGITL